MSRKGFAILCGFCATFIFSKHEPSQDRTARPKGLPVTVTVTATSHGNSAPSPCRRTKLW